MKPAFRATVMWRQCWIAAAIGSALALTAQVSLSATASLVPAPSNTGDPLAPVLNKMYNAQYAAAQQMLEAWVKSHPEDFRALNYLADTVMDREMVRENLFSGSVYMESGAMFKHRSQPLPAGIEKRIIEIFDRAEGLEEARLKQNPTDQDVLYWLGVTHAGLTEFNLVLLRSYFAALHQGKQSLKDNERLLELNPDYIDAYFVVGLAKYSIGMLPWYIRWVTSIAGYHGNSSEGIRDLERVSQHGHYAKVDAQIVLVAIYEREKQYSKALADLRNLGNAYPEDYLVPLEIARVQKAEGDWRAASGTYDSAVARFVEGEKDPQRIPTAEILYRAGEAHEHLGELRRALALYHKASQLPGKSMPVYRANLAAGHLDQHFNDTARAKQEYQLVASAVPGTDLAHEARQALQGLH